MKFKGYVLIGALAALAAPAAAQAEGKSLQLAKVVLDTETKPIEARVKGGTLCVFPSNIELPKEKKTQEFERYDQLVSGKLAEANVTLVTEAGDLFAAESADKGDILMGAVMAPTAINICSSVNGYKGTVEVKVEWQFYDRETQQVVEKIETTGKGTLAKFSNNGFVEMWDLAFVDALDKVEKQGVIARVLAADAPAADATVDAEATVMTEEVTIEAEPTS